ncbi:MAG: response regulator [Limisphaerales bacterium]
MQDIEPNDLRPQAQKIYEIPDDVLDAKGKTVLVLDDDAGFTDALKEVLEGVQYQVTVVPTGAEGVKQILASDFDAIVCDMVMPNFPGDLFYQAVQRSRPHLCRRFIFATGHKNDPRIVEFIKQTGRIALWKPFEMRELLDALEFVIRTK